jgi:signal transduction histidine kinase
VSLRGRLITAFAYLLVLTVAALAVPLAVNIDRRARTELEARLAEGGQLIASSVADAVDDGDVRPLRRVVSSYATDLDADVVVTDEDGVVVADSEASSLGSDLSERGEIARALQGERVRSVGDGIDGETLYVALPLVDREDVVGAVRVARPLSQLNATVTRSWLVLAAVGVFVVLIGLAIAWGLASSLARPLRNLSETATRLGAGDLEARAAEAGPRDVTEVARAMNVMAEDLQRSIDSQQDFVANASHQLRTPLTGMRLRLEGIAADGGAAAGSAQAALKEVDRLGDLVDDLLVLARTSRREATGSRIDLAESMREARDRWSERAVKSGHRLETQADEDVVVYADPSEIAAIFDNLVENAIAYTPRGSVIRMEARGDGHEQIISVEDNGPGIPSDDVARAFERCYRGKTGKSAGPGTGLGLAIVREVAERWGGCAALHTSESGTRVTVQWEGARGNR